MFTYIFTFLYFIVLRGYIEAIREIEQQLQSETGTVKFDDIVVACGRFCSMPSLILRVFTPNLFKRNGKTSAYILNKYSRTNYEPSIILYVCEVSEGASMV